MGTIILDDEQKAKLNGRDQHLEIRDTSGNRLGWFLSEEEYMRLLYDSANAEFAREEGVATPLFDATAPLYAAALAEGRGQQDTAAVYAILEKLSPTARLVDD